MSLLAAAPGTSVLAVACGKDNSTSVLAGRALDMAGTHDSRIKLTKYRTKYSLLALFSDRLAR